MIAVRDETVRSGLRGRVAAQKAVFDELLDRFGVELAEAFLKALADIRANIDFPALQRACEVNDPIAALAALNLDSAAYEPLEAKLREAYAEGGKASVEGMPDGTAAVRRLLVGFRFDVRNYRAEAWLRQHAGSLITGIMESQRENVRATLAEAMISSRHPRSTALDIAGRVNTVTGRREGGILGLSRPQREFVASARAELASADPEQLSHYLTRIRRDRRFDASVRKAIREGRPVPPEIAAKAIDRYGARLEQLRAETIGRTEALPSLRAAKLESFEQLVDSGRASVQDIEKDWITTRDGRERYTHGAMNRQRVGLRQPFRSPSGAMLMFPGDTSMGAPAAEIVACRCDFACRINWRALIGRRRA